LSGEIGKSLWLEAWRERLAITLAEHLPKNNNKTVDCFIKLIPFNNHTQHKETSVGSKESERSIIQDE
jgi:hypothetical protein